MLSEQGIKDADGIKVAKNMRWDGILMILINCKQERKGSGPYLQDEVGTLRWADPEMRR